MATPYYMEILGVDRPDRTIEATRTHMSNCAFQPHPPLHHLLLLGLPPKKNAPTKCLNISKPAKGLWNHTFNVHNFPAKTSISQHFKGKFFFSVRQFTSDGEAKSGKSIKVGSFFPLIYDGVLHPWKLTNILWKLMLGRWTFPFKMVPFQWDILDMAPSQ